MDKLVSSKANDLGKIVIPDGTSLFIKKENQNEHVKNLNENGYSVLDNKLSNELVSVLRDFSEKINCYDDYTDPLKAIDVKNEPKETHVAHYRREELVKKKQIMDIANDAGVLQIVQEFLGAKPTISNINMWWSFGGKKQAEHAQLFHRDLDDWKFCKLFVYLTDVNENAGPHIYVKHSSASKKSRKIRRYTDTEIENTFGKENIKTFTGAKGTAFLVNTYGFHKGLLPISENRLLLQVQYSLYPIGIEEYKPVSIEKNSYHPYINRLIIK